jgi:hypothetical protein
MEHGYPKRYSPIEWGIKGSMNSPALLFVTLALLIRGYSSSFKNRVKYTIKEPDALRGWALVFLLDPCEGKRETS